MGRALSQRASNALRSLLPARQGVGPLLQRDYWAVIDGCALRPSEVIDLVARRFPEFSPIDIAAFRRVREATTPLAAGDELSIQLALAGEAGVRVIHRSPTSLTLATLEGHPEAGRITFGAYRNDAGDVVFHIRSRARSSTRTNRGGFLALGDALQTECWVGFINAVAATVGRGVVGPVQATTVRLRRDEPGDAARHSPTYEARGD